MAPVDPTAPSTEPAYTTSLARRCRACEAVLPSRYGADLTCLGAEVICGGCGVVTSRDPVRCPHCLRVARFDEAGALYCPGGCAALAKPHGHMVDSHPSQPNRGAGYSVPGPGECERALPYSGWELVLRERVRAVDGTDAGDAAITSQWGLTGLTDGAAWDRYGGPASRLQLRWGAPGDDGREVFSEAGVAYEKDRMANLLRIADMQEELDGFRDAIRADPSAGRRGKDVYERQAWEWLYEIGGTLAKLLVNAIVTRGGSYEGVDELLSYAEMHDTPFGSYRAALWFAFYAPVKAIGEGSPMAGLGNAEYEYGLPSGPLFGSKIAVNPSRSGGAVTRGLATLHLDRDVWRCIEAARVGGEWEPAGPQRPEARVCFGGRPLLAWERELVRLCDVGVEVVVGEDWRRLAVAEAVPRVQQEAAKLRDDAGWAGARHLTVDGAKAALPRLRKALTDALVAWEMIPERREMPARPPKERDPDGPPAKQQKPPRGGKACDTWDPEAE